MKRATAFLCLFLLLPVGCARRVVVQKPTGSITIDDRVVNLFDASSLNEVIAKLPAVQQEAVIKEWISARERVATAALNREQNQGSNILAAFLEVLKTAASVWVGTQIK